MIDTSNWKYFYKLDPCGSYIPTNLLYTPLVNEDKSAMCMVWDEHSPYQLDNDRLDKELIDFFFNREVKYLKVFENKSWAPKIIDIDEANRKICIEWNKDTLNRSIYDPTRSLEQDCPDWKEQIYSIIKDIVDCGYYKMALYPHCFFADTQGKLKTFDFYSVVPMNEKYLEKKRIEGMIGWRSVARFDEATTDGIIDFEVFFKNTVKNHLGNAWPNNPFPDYYKRLFPNEH